MSILETRREKRKKKFKLEKYFKMTGITYLNVKT